MFHVPSFIDAHRNGPFHSAVHLMYQPKFPEFGVELKAPYMSSILDDIKCFFRRIQLSTEWEMDMSCGHCTDFYLISAAKVFTHT